MRNTQEDSAPGGKPTISEKARRGRFGGEEKERKRKPRKHYSNTADEDKHRWLKKKGKLPGGRRKSSSCYTEMTGICWKLR